MAKRPAPFIAERASAVAIPHGRRAWGPGSVAAAAAAAALATLLGCSSVEDEFLGSRVEDACDGTWPVCATTAGCIIGDRSYVSGRFPGTAKAVVQLFEPSEVTVSLLLTELASTGEETVFSFFEDRCRARIREPVSGKVILDEMGRTGIITRSADLTGIGDHLVEVASDARMSYRLKVDVVPTRLKDAPRE